MTVQLHCNLIRPVLFPAYERDCCRRGRTHAPQEFSVRPHPAQEKTILLRLRCPWLHKASQSVLLSLRCPWLHKTEESLILSLRCPLNHSS
jgi:hypothetical protein